MIFPMLYGQCYVLFSDIVTIIVCATTHKIIIVKIAAIAIRCIFMASTLVEMLAGTNITIDFGISSSLCKTAVSTLQRTYLDYQHTRMVTAPIYGHILLFLVVQPS